MHPGQVVAAFLAFLLFAGVGGVLAAGLVMPVVATTGALAQASSELFDELPSELGSEQMSEQSVLRDRNGKILARFYLWNRITVPMEKIDPLMGKAVIAIEDHRFYDHGGIDTEGMVRAAFMTLSTDSLQGGSTLTQQYVKNVLVENSRIADDQEAYMKATDPSLGRKLREAKMAITLEKTRSKDDILEGYLNIAQFGASVWGVEAASRHYFSHSAAEMTPAEAALLAGITNAPNKYDPVLNPENSENRRNQVLTRMREEGFISKSEYDEAVATPLEDMLKIRNTTSGCVAAKISAYFCDYVTQVILNDPAFGETRAERGKLLTQGGLNIKTTIDPDMQKEAFRALTETIPENDESGISTALSTVEPGTGEILAMAQNTTFGKATKKRPRATEVNFNTDRDYGGSSGFQSGSTFKAFVLAAWLEAGKSLHEMVDAPPKKTFSRASWTYEGCTDWADDYDSANIEQSARRLTVLEATKRSSNTGYVTMANQLNMCDIAAVAEAMGLERATGPNEFGDKLEYNASFVVGTNTVSPLRMAGAFATFAANGTYCEPIAILSIKDKDGNDLPVPESDCREVIDPSIAAGVTHALQEVTGPGGTGHAAGIPGRPTAGKTGTSDEDADAWFVGYIPQASTAVWVGHSESRTSMFNSWINGRFYPEVFGGAIAAPIWGNYMAPATADLEVKHFPRATEKMIYGERKSVPLVLGMSIDEAQEVITRAGFNVQVGDRGYSDRYPEGTIGWQSSTGRELPGTLITIRPSEGPEPEEEDEDEEEDDRRSSRRGNSNDSTSED